MALLINNRDLNMLNKCKIKAINVFIAYYNKKKT